MTFLKGKNISFSIMAGMGRCCEAVANGSFHGLYDDENCGFLFYAVRYDHPNCIGSLVKIGTNVNNLFLRLAVFNGHLDCVKKLIAKGADVNAKDKNGLSMLHHAAWNGHLSCLEELINNGADVNARDNEGKLFFEDISTLEIEAKVQKWFEEFTSLEIKDPGIL